MSMFNVSGQAMQAIGEIQQVKMERKMERTMIDKMVKNQELANMQKFVKIRCVEIIYEDKIRRNSLELTLEIVFRALIKIGRTETVLADNRLFKNLDIPTQYSLASMLGYKN